MLDQVLGPGQAVVRIASELDYSQVQETSEKYDPENSAITTETTTTETTTTHTPDSSPAAGGDGQRGRRGHNGEVERAKEGRYLQLNTRSARSPRAG